MGTQYNIIDAHFPHYITPGVTYSGMWIKCDINGLMYAYLSNVKNYVDGGHGYGKTTLELSASNTSTTITTLADFTIPPTLPPGEYFIHLRNDDGLMYTYDLRCRTTLCTPLDSTISANITYEFTDVSTYLAYVELTENSSNEDIDTWIWYLNNITYTGQHVGQQYPMYEIGNVYTVDLYVKTTSNKWNHLTKTLTVGTADPNPTIPDVPTYNQISINVSNNSQLTNYPLKFTIHRSTGTTSGENIYIGTAGCQSDYGDIRFVDEDGNELSYWIESYDASSAIIWVKIPIIITDLGTSIILKYINSSSSQITTSNGNETFDLFDDFTVPNVNVSKWVDTHSGNISINTGILTVTKNEYSHGIFSQISYSNGYALRSNYYPLQNSYTEIGWGIDSNNYLYSNLQEYYNDVTELFEIRIYEYETPYQYQKVTDSINAYTICELQRINNTAITGIYNEVSSTLIPINSSRNCSIGVMNISYSTQVDWILLRKCVDESTIITTYSLDPPEYQTYIFGVY